MAKALKTSNTLQSSLHSGGLIISTKEARKILGKDAQGMSDSQIEEMIELLTGMATDFLQD